MSGSLDSSSQLSSVAFSQTVHSWIAEQAVSIFTAQFDNSNVASYENIFVAGSYDEDEKGMNPFGNDIDADHPSLRHFWGHSSNLQRSVDEGVEWLSDDGGLAFFDSAPNRALKYFTGGVGYVGSNFGLDSTWGDGISRPGQGNASPFNGAMSLFSEDPAVTANGATAIYYLGHAVHLLQDMTVPAHAHADPHLDVLGLAFDPDPFHDWVDGLEFSTSVLNGTRQAQFNNDTPQRWETWGIADQAQAYRIRAIPGITPGFDLENPASIQTPLLQLFLDAASRADDFDSKNANGQLDNGSRRGQATYADWTKPELDHLVLQRNGLI